MAYALVPPRVRGVRWQGQTRLGGCLGKGLRRHLVGQYGQWGVAFLMSPVSVAFDRMALGVVVKISPTLCLGGMAVVLRAPAIGVV